MCSLKQIFQEEYNTAVDEIVSGFFPSAECTNVIKEKNSRTFNCYQFNLILLLPRHLQFADKSEIVIETSSVHYQDMNIRIEGIVLDWNTKLQVSFLPILLYHSSNVAIFFFSLLLFSAKELLL